MEVEVNISDVLKVDEDGFICLNGRDYLKHIRNQQQQNGLMILSKIINSLGQKSAISQKLKQVITNSIKFFSTDQRIYIKVNGNKALGFVKVGQKKLFYHDYIGNIKQLMPTAVLDIYVHESCQRTGIGKEIFEKFLTKEMKVPQKLAYDRPSQKLISFLKKYYNLSSFIPQNNNYVIFDRYFDKIEKPHTSNTYSKVRIQPMGQKTINITKSSKLEQQQDSLNKFQNQYMKKRNFDQHKNYFKEVKDAKDVKQTKDQSKSSFGCPWAIQQKIGFRTTSNAYGNYYKNKI